MFPKFKPRATAGVLLAGSLAVAAAGCGSSNGKSSSDTTTKAASSSGGGATVSLTQADATALRFESTPPF